MSMSIKSAVVHYIEKQAHKPASKVDIATSVISASPELERLVEAVLSTYNNKHAKQAGVFQVDQAAYPFSLQLASLQTGGTLLGISAAMMPRLVALMNLSTASTGGHVFFAHYDRDGAEYLLVVKLLTVPGQVFSQLAAVVDATHISVERLQVAARINLDSWRNGVNERYVTFVSTREGGHTSVYFREFIGCDVTAESRVESKKLAAVVHDYLRDKFSAGLLTEEEVAVRKQMVFDHASSAAKSQLPISLSDVSSVIWPSDQTDFLTYLAGHVDPPVDMFSPDKKSLRSLSEYSYRSKEFKLSMTHEFKIKHNVTINAQHLTIENPPEELIAELTS